MASRASACWGGVADGLRCSLRWGSSHSAARSATFAACSSFGTDASSSSVRPVSSLVPAIWVRTSGATRSPRVASRWTTRSLWPVLAAVSAVKRGAESPTWRLWSWPPPVAPCFVSGFCASYANLRRRVNNARSAAVRFVPHRFSSPFSAPLQIWRSASFCRLDKHNQHATGRPPNQTVVSKHPMGLYRPFGR
jgi:hypothetical protein